MEDPESRGPCASPPYVFAIIGFASGLASFLLVDRQEKAAGLIAVLMLAGWVWLLLEEPIRRFVRLITGFSIPPTLIRFTTQVVHQESFFFVLPFFAITTTWTSPQTLFTVMIGIAGLISIIDPVYHGRLAKHRWIYLAYHCLALSVVLLTALPIIVHLTTWETYAITTALTVVLALPSIIQIVPLGGAVKGPAWWALFFAGRSGMGGKTGCPARDTVADRQHHYPCGRQERPGRRAQPQGSQRRGRPRARALCLYRHTRTQGPARDRLSRMDS